ncbi:hypothetical protein PENSPDRAFT_757754 [Peniophora sp. CONT]|nr:hypothetical protein PENSPDRAFT_757754 [Peniophora sp. CONT]
MDTINAHTLKQLSDVEEVPASDLWLSIARQRLAGYHAKMSHPDIPRSSERFAQLSRAMRTEASVLEQISKLFLAQWHADVPGINSLPREILDYIFFLVAAIDRPCPPYDCHAPKATGCRLPGMHHNTRESNITKRYPVLGNGGYLGWLRMGHVSQSWRNALLELPLLWASDIGLLPRGLDPMLERARHMPLTFRAYSTTCRPEAGALLVPMVDGPVGELVPRIRELEIIDIGENRMKNSDDVFKSCTFPLLESATICNGLHDLIRPLSVLPIIQAPCLRSLHFIQTFYPWSSSMLASLSIGDSDGPQAYDMLMILDAEHIDYIVQTSASSLETLSIARCYTEAVVASQNPTFFPRLRSLRLYTTIDWQTDWEVHSMILKSTTLPATARLVVTTTLGDDEADQGAIVAVIKECISAKEACNLNGLVITDSSDPRDPLKSMNYPTLAFYLDGAVSGQVDTVTQHDALQAQSPLVISHIFSFSDENNVPVRYLEALVEASVLPQFTTIVYMARTSHYYFDEGYMNTLPSFLGASSSVRVLSIRVVERDWDDDNRDKGWQCLTEAFKGPVLPRLERLALHDIVDLQGLPDIFRSRLRSLEEAGQTVSKLKEFSLSVTRDADGVSAGRDGDDAALVSALHEFADSVVLSHV